MFVIIYFALLFPSFCQLVLCFNESPVITRESYDLMLFPTCAGQSRSNFRCDKVNAIRTASLSTCTCRCKLGFVTYRDPTVSYDAGFKYNVNEVGCVWYGNYREGCHVLESIESLEYLRGKTFPKPIILDLTQSQGTLTLQSEHYHAPTCVTIEAYSRAPGENSWRQVTDVVFSLVKLQRTLQLKRFFRLQWQSHTNHHQYSRYEGLIMRLDLYDCLDPSTAPKCIMTKIAGTYTGPGECQLRTVTGRCCIFPFVYNGISHNSCIRTGDLTQPWCAVGLNTSVNQGNHNWRELCDYSTMTQLPTAPPIPSTPPKPTQTITLPSYTKPRTNTSYRVPTTTTAVVTTLGQNSSGNAGRPRNSDDNTLQSGHIIAISVVSVVLLVGGGVAVGVVLLWRRKAKLRNPLRSQTAYTNDVEEEGPYASVPVGSHVRDLTNYGFRDSVLELSPPTVSSGASSSAGVTKGYISTDQAEPSSQQLAADEAAYMPDPDPVYTMPESDYSLIVTPSQGRSNIHPFPHVYSVLERDDDPVPSQPTDNDKVFVEFNPLYGTIDILNNFSGFNDEEEQIYEDPAVLRWKKRISDIPELSEKDV